MDQRSGYKPAPPTKAPSVPAPTPPPGPGRPALAEDARLTEVLQVRLTSDEADRLCKHAFLGRKSVSAAIRAAVLRMLDERPS
jgi:hypothetical protein